MIRAFSCIIFLVFLSACQQTDGADKSGDKANGKPLNCLKGERFGGDEPSRFDIDNDVIKRGASLSCSSHVTATDASELLIFLASLNSKNNVITEIDTTNNFFLPLRVNRINGSDVVYENPRDIINNIRSIVSPDLSYRLSRARVSDLDNVGSRGTMIFDGEIWFDVNTRDGRFKVLAVNADLQSELQRTQALRDVATENR